MNSRPAVPRDRHETRASRTLHSVTARGRGHRALIAVTLGLLLAVGHYGTARAQSGTAGAATVQSTQAAPASGWAPQTKSAPGITAQTFDAKQIETIKKVNAYFNALDKLEGQFLQTAADAKRQRGKFYVKRPGRFRFDYSAPSRLLIVSDGRELTIFDPDSSDPQRIALDDTVFRILLRDNVDVMRDAHVLKVEEAADRIEIALQDKSSEGTGRIRLFLATTPAIELAGWVTTDAQGLDTEVQLQAVTRGKDVDENLFVPPKGRIKLPSGG